MSKKISVLSLILVIFVVTTSGQEVTGNLVGRVLDAE